jgi:hypothetical protein
MAKKKYNPSAVLGSAIESTGLAEVIKLSNGGQISAFFRVLDERSWARVLEYILVRKTCWDAHICKQYFMRGPKLVYGWNFIMQPSGDADVAIQEATTLILEGAKVAPKVPTARGQIKSFPLVGASPRRTTSKTVFDPRLPGPDRGGPSHKGAYPVKSGE